ncbi:MAG: winged helix-turn-helix transcriptional regulator [Clostridia bacterium]|nr:winged helix-turn-helix transcriptional regulator [Clostridia bacterium]
MKNIPSDRDTDNVIVILKMLADKTRLKIVYSLMSGAKCVSEIVAEVGESQSAISHQLATMKVSNLVKSERAGNKIIYSVADEHVNKVVKLCLAHAKELE